MSDFEQRVRWRAYKMWEDEGCPEGRSEIHWEMARELVAIEDNYRSTLKPVPAEGAEARGGEPIEEAGIAANSSELLTMVDQGEQKYPPARTSQGLSRNH
jgi:hypothetical protein